jgi:hypothetical protein
MDPYCVWEAGSGFGFALKSKFMSFHKAQNCAVEDRGHTQNGGVEGQNGGLEGL